MVYKTHTMRHDLDEIKADWRASSLDEKQNYVLELDEMAVDALQFQGLVGTRLLRDVGRLRDHIEQQILPAQRQRNLDARLGDEAAWRAAPMT
jgi:hypothetical protein